MAYADIALRPDQGDFAAAQLFKSATYLMAVEIRNAIKHVYENPKDSNDFNIVSAYKISRLIRNSFSHSPFKPIWYIDDDCQSKEFKIENVISLNTINLNRQPFDLRHYGGPLALLSLCRYVRFEVLNDEKKDREPFPDPKDIYYQQGDLILQQVEDDASKN